MATARATRSKSGPAEMPETAAGSKKSKPIKSTPPEDTFKFVVLPTDVDFDQTKIVTLPHPKNGASAQFVFSGSRVFELLCHDDPHRSWFVGDTVVQNPEIFPLISTIQDGRLFVCAAVHPLFLLLNALISNQESFVPLDQLLQDEPQSLGEFVANCPSLLKLLAAVCHVKEIQAGYSGDCRVYRYDEQLCLGWLQARVHKCVQLLKLQPHHVHHSIVNNNSALLRYSCGIVSDYLCASLTETLKHHLGVDKLEQEAMQSPEVKKSESAPLKRKHGEMTEPTDDYSITVTEVTKKAVVLTTKQKQLQKASAGSKSLSAFFKKKA